MITLVCPYCQKLFYVVYSCDATLDNNPIYIIEQ
jgi:hypothetical protein